MKYAILIFEIYAYIYIYDLVFYNSYLDGCSVSVVWGFSAIAHQESVWGIRVIERDRLTKGDSSSFDWVSHGSRKSPLLSYIMW